MHFKNPRAANEQKWASITQQNLWTICLQPIGHKQRKPCLTNQNFDRGINWCRMLFSFAIRFLEVSLVQQTSAEIFKHSSNLELTNLVFYPLMWFSDVVIFSCTTQWLATSRRDLGSSNHLSFGEERMNQQSLFVYKELWDTAGVWTQYCTYGIYCITIYNVWCLYQTTQALKSQHRSFYQVCDEYIIYLSLSQQLKKSIPWQSTVILRIYNTYIAICIQWHIYCNMMYIHEYLYIYIANIIKQ